MPCVHRIFRYRKENLLTAVRCLIVSAALAVTDKCSVSSQRRALNAPVCACYVVIYVVRCICSVSSLTISSWVLNHHTMAACKYLGLNVGMCLSTYKLFLYLDTYLVTSEASLVFRVTNLVEENKASHVSIKFLPLSFDKNSFNKSWQSVPTMMNRLSRFLRLVLLLIP